MITKYFNIYFFFTVLLFALTILCDNVIKSKSERKSFPILKSFTASCATNNQESSSDVGFCTYSVGFYSNPNGGGSTSYDASVSIVKNNVASNYEISVQLNSPYFINFAVESGDNVEIHFSVSISATPYTPYFEVYTSIDGQGVFVQSSKDTNRIPITNTCTSNTACTFTLDGLTTSSSWSSASASAIVCVNRNPVATFIGNLLTFPVNEGDIISIILPFTSPSNQLQLVINDDLSLIIFKWFSNAYYTPMQVLNYCVLQLPSSSPFGTKLYPIYPEDKLKEFLFKISASISTRWYNLGSEEEIGNSE